MKPDQPYPQDSAARALKAAKLASAGFVVIGLTNPIEHLRNQVRNRMDRESVGFGRLLAQQRYRQETALAMCDVMAEHPVVFHHSKRYFYN